MATDISKEINQLKNAVYGEEVRGAFLSCMEKIHEENESYDNIKAQVAQSAENVEKQVGAINVKAEEVQTSLDNLADAISNGKKQQTNLEETIKNAKTQQSAMIEELEENSNTQVNNFNIHVAEKTQESEQTIADARQQAVQTVKDETAEYIEEQKNTAKEEFSSHADEIVSELKEDISDLTDTIISIDKSNVSENVDNYENIESTIIKSNGKLESNSYTARFVVKKYINLTKASYTVKGFCQGNQCLYVLCDKNGDVIKYEDSTSQGSSGTKAVDITIDERDTILYVGGHETVIAVVKKYLYDVKLTTRLSNIYRKKVTLNGDSIAFGAGTGGTGFMDYIASKYNMTLDKKAVSGATIANLSSRYPDKHCICTSIDAMAEDANYIIFEGGYNDWLLWTQIGTLTDTMSGDLDDTKFYGALESICRQALAKWENGKIGFIITHKINDAWRTQKQEGATYPTLDGYYQAIKNVCEKYSIPYLDLSKVSRLNTELQNYKKYTYNSDGVHPTKDGYQIFYVDTIARWMENL